MSIDGVLVGAIVVFITVSEYLKDKADRETNRVGKIGLNVFSKFIEVTVIGMGVLLLYKYYKLA